MTHVIYRSRKGKNTPRVIALAWCGARAYIGEYVSKPYAGPGGVRLVKLEYRAYGPDFKPALRPAIEFVAASLAALGSCPDCKKAMAMGRARSFALK